MARSNKKKTIKDIPNKKILENDKEIIIVNSKVDFIMETEKSPCDNCGNLHNFKTIYETLEKQNVGICYFCNKKVHNCTATNPRFRKDKILNPLKQVV